LEERDNRGKLIALILMPYSGTLQQASITHPHPLRELAPMFDGAVIL